MTPMYRINFHLRRMKPSVLAGYKFNRKTNQFEVKQLSVFAKIKKIVAGIRGEK